jgi:hypothetical protein
MCCYPAWVRGWVQTYSLGLARVVLFGPACSLFTCVLNCVHGRRVVQLSDYGDLRTELCNVGMGTLPCCRRVTLDRRFNFKAGTALGEGAD